MHIDEMVNEIYRIRNPNIFVQAEECMFSLFGRNMQQLKFKKLEKLIANDEQIASYCIKNERLGSFSYDGRRNLGMVAVEHHLSVARYVLKDERIAGTANRDGWTFAHEAVNSHIELGTVAAANPRIGSYSTLKERESVMHRAVHAAIAFGISMDIKETPPIIDYAMETQWIRELKDAAGLSVAYYASEWYNAVPVPKERTITITYRPRKRAR